MLVLSRQRDQSIIIGDNVVVTIVDIRGDQVQIGIDAPRSIPVHRYEIYEEIKSATADAADSDAIDMDAIKKKRKPKGSPPDSDSDSGPDSNSNSN